MALSGYLALIISSGFIKVAAAEPDPARPTMQIARFMRKISLKFEMVEVHLILPWLTT
ncbi:hypothetical protein BN1182_AA_00380 [Pantoea ananatis]|nr:hypothetical protein BN1182_AA_00380 [Pantoea ananatis]